MEFQTFGILVLFQKIMYMTTLESYSREQLFLMFLGKVGKEKNQLKYENCQSKHGINDKEDIKGK